MLVNKRSFKLIKTNSRLEKIFGRILSQVLLRPLSWLGHKARQILKSLFFPSRRGRVRLTFVFILLLAVLAGLVDWPKISKEIVVKGEGMVAAEFENLCIKEAINRKWKELI